MAPHVAPSVERLIEHYLPVKPAAIEDEFDRIWAEDGTGAGYDTSSVRLRLSTLVAWGTGAAGAAARFEGVMETLARHHPCRGILAITDPTVSALESSISAHCWRTAAGGRHACAEEILLRARVGGETELASAVLALIVAEVPANIWLLGDPGDSRLPEEIAAAADSLIVDSLHSTGGPGALRAISMLTDAYDVPAVDLAWVRGRVWRELCAQLFDGNEAQLDELREIDLKGGEDSVSSLALLQAGWLVSRLHLTPASVDAGPDRVSATYYDGTRAVQLTVTPDDDGHELRMVRLRAKEGDFTVEVHPASGHVHVRADVANSPVRRVVSREPAEDAAVILTALEGVPDGRLYDEALSAVLAFFEG